MTNTGSYDPDGVLVLVREELHYVSGLIAVWGVE